MLEGGEEAMYRRKESVLGLVEGKRERGERVGARGFEGAEGVGGV